MLKKTLVSLLAASLIAAPATGAFAKAKKKKGPKPYVSEEVTIQAGHPAFHGNSGTLLTVTAQEFIRTCAIPNSNGVDAAVYEVPADYKGLTATIKALGTAPGPNGYDVDIYLFDESCTEVGVYNATGTDEIGILTPDAAFIVLHQFAVGPVTAHFELAVSK